MQGSLAFILFVHVNNYCIDILWNYVQPWGRNFELVTFRVQYNFANISTKYLVDMHLLA